MQIAPVDPIYSAYDPFDISEISADNIAIVNNASNEESLTTNRVSGLELPATAVAINPISQESIEFQELQDNIVSSFNDLKEGKISNEDFTNTLEELGVKPQNFSVDEQNNQNITDLTSSLIESLKGTNQGTGEIELSAYASIMDIVNKETQTPKINEQLQAYTQNLKY
ncbi:hypothetical protein [Arcobacter arenosus]|uniref:hypothetical protein n=1 Tax=Arcobacter arenosus TaxID=2576037 RepID=UPI003BAB545E